MMKHEFEALALRGNKTISQLLYDTIERYYMSENNYHAAHGGIYETKQEFVKRVFGGKVNTPKTITKKMIEEAIKENRWCLIGTTVSNDEQKMKHMDEMITDQLEWEARQN